MQENARCKTAGLLLGALVLCLGPGGPVAMAGAGPAGSVEVGSSPEADRPVASDGYWAPDPQLRDLIDRLRRENPNLQGAAAGWRSISEKVALQGALPDPQLTYRYFERWPETRVGPQRHGLELSQQVPWFGKRGLVASRAEHDARGGAWSVVTLEQELVAELKRAYLDAGYLQEALAINRDEEALLQRFEKIALTRYATGEGNQQAVLKVQTDVTRLMDRETRLLQELETILSRLSRLVGRPEKTLALDDIPLALVALPLDLPRLEAQAVASHPRVQAVESRVESDRAWLRRRSLESRPDFRFGVAYTEVDDRRDLPGRLLPPPENGKDIVALSVGLNLPIYRKRIRAGIIEARESLAASESAVDVVKDHLRFAIQDAGIRAQSLGERARLYRDVLIPQAEESLASAEAAYTTNREDFLDLLDAQRTLFQVRLTYHRLLADHGIALADLERAAGRPVFDSETSGDPEAEGA